MRITNQPTPFTCADAGGVTGSHGEAKAEATTREVEEQPKADVVERDQFGVPIKRPSASSPSAAAAAKTEDAKTESSKDGFQYATKAEAKKAFKALLTEKGVKSTWSWDEAMKVVSSDSRYGALKTLGERRQCFKEYLEDRKVSRFLLYFHLESDSPSSFSFLFQLFASPFISNLQLAFLPHTLTLTCSR